MNKYKVNVIFLKALFFFFYNGEILYALKINQNVFFVLCHRYTINFLFKFEQFAFFFFFSALDSFLPHISRESWGITLTEVYVLFYQNVLLLDSSR